MQHLQKNRGWPHRLPIHGNVLLRDGTKRIEIRKLPFFRPTTSNLQRFSAPPLLEVRAGLPPESSAISGARIRASSPTFAYVTRTRTVRARWSIGFNGV